MKEQAGLSIVVFAGGFDRAHYALVMASAAAAVNRKTTLFFTGRALLALTQGEGAGAPGWHGLDPADDGSSPAARDQFFAAGGMATFEELLEACALLNVRILACEMGLRALGLRALGAGASSGGAGQAAALRADIPVETAGVVTFLAAAEGAQTLFI